MNFAIIGASGNVGRKTIEILEKSKIAIDNLFLVASSKSAGKKIKFKNKEIEIEDLENYNFSRAQITFFASGSKVAKEWVPKAAKETIVIIIDKTTIIFILLSLIIENNLQPLNVQKDYEFIHIIFFHPNQHRKLFLLSK